MSVVENIKHLNVVENIKLYRTTYGLSVKDVAEVLDRTQKEINAFEKGTVEPDIMYLRDLAMMCKCGVEDLRGNTFVDCGHVVANSVVLGYSDDEKIDGYWGNVGILLKGEEKSRWYPISREASCRIQRGMESCSNWFWVHTLNNRMLLIDRTKVRKITLLDEALDHIEGDWELPIDGCSGAALEVYAGLELMSDLNLDEADAENNTSKKYKTCIAEYAKEWGLDSDEKLIDFLWNVTVFEADGAKTKIMASETCLEWVYTLVALELDEENQPCFVFDEDDRTNAVYIARDNVAMVDMPLLRLIKGIMMPINEADKEDSSSVQ